MRTSTVVGLGAALLTVACGCGSSQKLTPELEASPLTVGAPADFDMEAAAEGVLAEVEGCLGVQRDGNFMELAWRVDDVQWEPDTRQVLFQGVALGVGDDVRFGGGVVGWDLDYLTRPEGCEDVEVTWLVSSAGVSPRAG